MNRKSLGRLIALYVIGLGIAATSHAVTVYVNKTAPGPAHDGTTWTTAFLAVQAGVDAASSGDEIHVAKGAYVELITLKDGVKLLGGYAGSGPTPDQRDPASNVTTLDGGAGGSVVTIPTQTGAPAMVDGFTIRNGGGGANGAGINIANANPTISHNILTQNANASAGGGIYVNLGAPIIVNNTLIGNQANAGGAGLWLESSQGARVADNTFTLNRTGGIGGAIMLRGGSATIVNNTLVENQSGSTGGGIYCDTSPAGTIQNNIVAFNSSGIHETDGTFIEDYNCLFENSVINYDGLSPGAHDIQADPLVAEDANGDFHIQPTSPCRDHGTNSVVQAGDTDIDGQARIQPAGGTVDIGADESNGATFVPSQRVVYVKPASAGGSDANDGASWATAKATVQAGIDTGSLLGGEVWVKAGKYNERITLNLGVSVYGGFIGTESVRSARPDPRLNPSVLDGGAGGSVVSASGLPVTTVVDGFTIQNGGGGANGAGLNLTSSYVVVSHNLITRNLNASGGGGVYVNGGAPVIVNNTIIGNQANAGGAGVWLEAALGVRLANNTISQNRTAGIGGAVLLRGGTAIIVNNTLVNNASASNGGGVYCDTSPAGTIANNLIAFNSSGIHKSDGTFTEDYNCLYQNSNLDFDGIAPGAHDIQTDPQIARNLRGDFHIQPTSPSRNHGDNSVVLPGDLDIDNQARIQDGTVDIGADESDGTIFAPSTLVVYVRADGSDAGDGSTWALAKKTVQAAIAAADLGGEVWVKAGTYNERITFSLGVSVYGGFTGTEALRSARPDPALNPSILDGGAGGSVVSIPGGITPLTVLDGFTIRNGGGGANGAGINIANANPTISHNILTQNLNASGGGGVYVNLGAPIITNNTFIGNQANAGGGGLWLDSSQGARVADNTFTLNRTAGIGGAILLRGGSATIVNNTLVENQSSGVGGAIYCDTSPGGTIQNNVIAFNNSGIHQSDGTFTEDYNCLFQNSLGSYDGLPAGSHDIQSDPKAARDTRGEFHIQPTSPCRNAGNNAVVQPGDLDIDGQARIQQGIVDIGADESDGVATFVPSQRVVFVRSDGSDANDGSSWALAVQTVQAGINATSFLGGEVWVKAGLYTERINLNLGVSVYGGFTGTETVRSQRLDPHLNPSTLDGGAGGSVVTIPSGIPSSTVFDGFTIRNGGGGANGAGINIAVSNPVITHNLITGNTNASGGGGIYSNGGSPTITNNQITDNQANAGAGGVWLDSGANPRIADNIIARNSTAGIGGGILLRGGSATIVNNTIVDNQSGSTGGGLYCDTSPGGTVENNVIAFNGSGIHKSDGTFTEDYNDVYENSGQGYDGLSAGPHDVSQDPLLISLATSDYRLNTGSPAVNAGDDGQVQAGDSDVYGYRRLVGAHVDIGAHELQADVRIAMTVSDTAPVTGTAVTYTLKVTNSGPDSARTVLVTDNVPVNLTNVSVTNAGGGTPGGSGNNRTVSFTSFPTGQTATITIQATVDCAVPNGTVIANGASVATVAPPTVPTPDPDATNNSATAPLTVSNPVPIITPPANKVVSNDAGLCSAVVTYASAGVTDNCPGVNVVYSKASGTVFNKGTTTVNITATDSGGGVSSSSFTVTVNDTEAPVISGVSASPALLLKANHRMVNVTINYTSIDNCDPSPVSSLSAVSNEADSGTGAGDLAGDIVVVDNHHVQLRAERAGSSQARVYTVTIHTVDSAGNPSTRDVTVTVPVPSIGNAKRALQIWGGLVNATQSDIASLDVEASGAIDLKDAIRLTREAAGLEP